MIDPVSLMTIFTSIIPTANYALKRIIDYKTGGPAPSNSGEAVDLRKADVEMLKALYASESLENASKWAINLRVTQRPLVVYVILLNWTMLTLAGLAGHHVDLQIYVIVANLASAAFFYLFGDRTLMYSLQNLNTKLFGGKK